MLNRNNNSSFIKRYMCICISLRKVPYVCDWSYRNGYDGNIKLL